MYTEREKGLKLIIECDVGEAAEQVISQLCEVIYSLPSIGYYVVEVSKKDYGKISGLKGVKAVHSTARITAQSARGSAAANYTIHSDYDELLTGSGVGIAILDTGIAPIDDFCLPKNRIVAFKDFVNGRSKPYDDNAHGTHVAGIAAGNGVSSHGKYKGVAPECNIIGVKILDGEGKGDTAEVLAGIQWIIDNKDKYNIRAANLSIGTGDKGSDTPLVRAVEAAWDKGIVVCVAAGNNGPKSGSITSPGISRKVITVGSSDDKNSVQIWGATLVNFSGRGPTAECIVKPDIVAPGSNIVSCLSPTPNLSGKRKNELKVISENYVQMSGTSMSTPMATGAVALMLQRYPGLLPDDIKYMLKQSAVSINCPQNYQGWGVLDIRGFLNQEGKHVR